MIYQVNDCCFIQIFRVLIVVRASTLNRNWNFKNVGWIFFSQRGKKVTTTHKPIDSLILTNVVYNDRLFFVVVVTVYNNRIIVLKTDRLGP